MNPLGGFARRQSYWNEFSKKYPAKPYLRIDGGALFSIGAAESPVVNRWMLEGTRKSNLDALGLNAWDLPAWQELGDLAAAGMLPRELLSLPLVSANVAPKAASFPAVRRSIIKEVSVDPKTGRKFRVGITALLFDPEERISRGDFAVEDPAVAARKVIAELRPATDYRVVLTDADLGRAMSLAIGVPGINLLVVSHDYVAASDAQQIGDTLIVVTVNEGRMFSDVRLQVPAGSARIQAEMRFVPLDRTIPDDAAMGEFVRRGQTAVDDVKKGKSPAY